MLKILPPLLTLLVLLLTPPTRSSILLDLFTLKDRHGQSIRIQISPTQCSTFPVSWTSKSSSINTLGSCVQLYDEPFCKGALTIIQPFHTIHQMDLSLINFSQRIQSAAACGPKIKTGRYVLQNAEDATLLTVKSRFGGFARAFTRNGSAEGVVTRAQQWEVTEIGSDTLTYSLRPREYFDNYPVSYDEEMLKKGQIKKKLWKISSVGRGRYIIKDETTNKCLYKAQDGRVEEHDCRIWSSSQEWILKEIFPSSIKNNKEKSKQQGPGLNYNIISKVASFVPPTKPPPQFDPVLLNVSALAKMKRKPTPSPYIVRKKIKRGPRPVTRPLPAELNLLRPYNRVVSRPGVNEKVGNSNLFLLSKPNDNNKGAEFVPSDDRLETVAYYQSVIKEQDMAARERTKAILAYLLKMQRLKKQAEQVQKQQKDQQELDKKKKKKDNSSEEEEDDKNSEENNDVTEEEDDDEPSKKRKSPPPPLQAPPRPPLPYSPYTDVNYSAPNTSVIHDQIVPSGSFFGTFYNSVKSLSPFSTTKSDSGGGFSPPHVQHGPHQPHIQPHPHSYHQQPIVPPQKEQKLKGKKKLPHLLRPGELGGVLGLRLPKNQSTTTEKSFLGFLG